MKKTLALLLVLGMILCALTPGLADSVQMDTTLLQSMDYSAATWISTESNRCLLTVLAALAWGIEANSSNRYEVRLAEPSFTAKTPENNLYVFFSAYDTYSGQGDYVMIGYNPSEGIALYDYFEECSSSAARKSVSVSESFPGYYENDVDTIGTVISVLKDIIGS